MNSARPSLPIGVLISGGGTTLRNLIEKIEAGELAASVRIVISSSATAGGIAIATEAGLPCEVVPRRSFDSAEGYSAALFDHVTRAGVALVVMGGFLKRLVVPGEFQHRVMNIHPALIPAFCGHGCYGRRVHEAVLQRGVKLTGCTVHFVDNEYDHGPIILQRAVPVLDGDTPQTLAARVFEQECIAYPQAIRLFAAGRLRVRDGRVVVNSSRNPGEQGRGFD